MTDQQQITLIDILWHEAKRRAAEHGEGATPSAEFLALFYELGLRVVVDFTRE